MSDFLSGFAIPTREDWSRRSRRERYWRSLLAMKPTGNAMVDAGLHEEMRCALRDALHVIQDLSCANNGKGCR